MNGFVGVTDNDWFAFLAQQPGIDEVNFWQPSGKSQFRALKPGEPFLFKLHAPQNYVVGGGFFAHSSILPISLAWKAFGLKNGANSLLEMKRRTEKYRREKSPSMEDYKIGCIILTQPFFFFSKNDWIPVPPDFSLNIVQGKTYNLNQGHGQSLWNEVLAKLASTQIDFFVDQRMISEQESRYGPPTLVLPRLGQGGFRVIVTDAYQRRCAITQEKTLPTLEAAHIKPFSDSGPHLIENGILLRSDIHRLFDSGYVTVSPDYHFEVSRRIHEEFDNGRYYYGFHGGKIHAPADPQCKPSREFLTWHNENVFRG
ncbi:MAG TPA: HNH endonuclease [Anaerolineae bacterium]|nr:HNH endonuclease [Anaerolineae bacterium]